MQTSKYHSTYYLPNPRNKNPCEYLYLHLYCKELLENIITWQPAVDIVFQKLDLQSSVIEKSSQVNIESSFHVSIIIANKK